MSSPRVTVIVAALVACALVAIALWLWTPDLPRAALERSYLASPEDLVEVSGTVLHVRDTGPRGAPAVILLHGFGSSLHTWEAWAGVLASDHRVIRIDLPGSGLSPADPTGDYSDARTLRLLDALMTQRGVARASVIGNSIGGRIAWRFAAEHPQRVDRLVLVSPDGFASPGFDYGRAPEVARVIQLMRYVLPRFVLRMNLAPAYAESTRLTDPVVTRYHDLLRAPGVRAAQLARMAQTVLQEPRPLLQRIVAPTLLLWGEQDRLIPIANAADYLAAIPDSRLVSLPDVGHVPQEEAAQASLVPVRAFLSQPAGK